MANQMDVLQQVTKALLGLMVETKPNVFHDYRCPGREGRACSLRCANARYALVEAAKVLTPETDGEGPRCEQYSSTGIRCARREGHVGYHAWAK